MSSAQPGEVPADPAVASLEREILALEVLSPNDRLDAFEAAVGLEERARHQGLPNLMHRARLIGAVAQGRRGQLAASARVIREVNRWAIEHQDSYLLARSHRHLSHVTRLLGDFAISLEHAVRAVELTAEDFPEQVRFEHDHVLAIALARAGDPAAASRRFAILDADPALDEQPWLRVSVLNNMAFMAVQNGRFDEALTAAERMVATAEDHELTLQAAYVDTYCQVMLAAGTPETAVTFMDHRLHELEGSSDVDSVADCYLTLAQAQRLTGRLQAAHETLDRASRLARARDLVEIQARVKAERAELYAAQGRYQDAFEEHKRYSAAMAVLNSIERDGRAKIAAAVFETAEAHAGRPNASGRCLRWTRSPVCATVDTLTNNFRPCCAAVPSAGSR